jgi:aldose sugar dehydrogenase
LIIEAKEEEQMNKRQTLKVLGASTLATNTAFLPSPSNAQTTAAPTGSTPASTPAPIQIQPTTGPELAVTEIANGLTNPWSVAVLPDGRYLVTERPGRINLIEANGKKISVDGAPTVYAQGQGGLLDVVLSPNFEKDANIFFSYSEPVTGSESRTAVARARLVGTRLTDLAVIFRQSPTAPAGYHFGSRLVFDREGFLFVTTGDRYQLRDQAQNLSNHLGKVLRITAEGKPAPGNPFLNRGTSGAANTAPEIWSYGHRNMQGAALHPNTGQLWTNEHGARGGDEINLCLPGKNYGWPIITHGVDYSGAKIGEGSAKAGLEQPLHFWVPSIAVSGMAFDRALTQGNRTVVWVGGLAGQVLARVTFENNVAEGKGVNVAEGKGVNVAVKEERFLRNLGQRIRDVRQVADGRLLVLTDSANGKLLVTAKT